MKLEKFYNRFPYLKFPIKLFSVFLPLQVLYLCIISASHPDGKLYSPFVIKYLNIIEWLRQFLLFGSKKLLSFFGIETAPYYTGGLRIPTGGIVNLNNACLGWAVLSFWVAFIYANKAPLGFKLKWLFAGIAFICLLNMIRVSLLLYALNQRWQAFVSIDQHTLFNIFAYLLLFLLMFLFAKAHKKAEIKTI